MASSHSTIIFMATLVILATSISAKEYIVGDGSGWTLDFDYQAWAKDKVFTVGDTLVFNYAPGAHNVMKVDGNNFQQCNIAPLLNGTLTSGRDVIPLKTSGMKWYICGVGKHCELRKMKLAIAVLPQTMIPAPAPSVSQSSKLAVPSIYGFVVALFGGLVMLLA
ncbi:hypothetical protein L2E82_47573 [Cichorium intybus]|uniref:Uncharacterized protein n=1 Tax=Cichorium intybus TaxID=13427 RepID=A0ACB8YX27_CICIN|nr:hypothetical protein L2E82_47573 [Cichorium intybus]